MTTYPRTIDNGAGEQLTFVAVGRDERGEFLEVRNFVAPGAGPPRHVHQQQEEAATVQRGRLGYVIEGGPERFAGPGETVFFAAGVAHRFWNAGREELVCTGTIRPPGNIEYFLTQIYASLRRTGGKRPGMLDAAYLSFRYRNEFAITQVPAPVRRFVFPVLFVVGRLLGRHRRFAGAPRPLGPPAP